MSVAIGIAPASAYSAKVRSYKTIRLIDVMIALIAIEFISGGIIIGRELIEAHRVQQQIAQISGFNSAVGAFYEKYNGLPGDLLAAQADRIGLPTGNGTPAHSDGDGKISACSPGWQAALGCESGLFWAQLAASELIQGNYTASVRFADSRVEATDLLTSYLPQSTLASDVYLTVWNSDRNELGSRANYIPDGNYFELSALRGVEKSKLTDEPYAISPTMAREIDRKIDDGYPLRGKIIVNGDSDDPNESWSTYAKTGELECVTPGELYNTHEYVKAHRRLCHLAIAMDNYGGEN